MFSYDHARDMTSRTWICVYVHARTVVSLALSPSLSLRVCTLTIAFCEPSLVVASHVLVMTREICLPTVRYTREQSQEAPTLRVLERLSGFASTDDVLQHSRRREHELRTLLRTAPSMSLSTHGSAAHSSSTGPTDAVHAAAPTQGHGINGSEWTGVCDDLELPLREFAAAAASQARGDANVKSNVSTPPRAKNSSGARSGGDDVSGEPGCGITVLSYNMNVLLMGAT